MGMWEGLRRDCQRLTGQREKIPGSGLVYCDCQQEMGKRGHWLVFESRAWPVLACRLDRADQKADAKEETRQVTLGNIRRWRPPHVLKSEGWRDAMPSDHLGQGYENNMGDGGRGS